MKNEEGDDRLVAALDDGDQRFKFSMADLGELCAQLPPNDLLILLSRLPSVVLLAVKDAKIVPVVEPGAPPQDARTFPLVISASDQLETRLGEGLVNLCRDFYGVEPSGHSDRLLLMIPKAKVLPSAPTKAIPLKASGQ